MKFRKTIDRNGNPAYILYVSSAYCSYVIFKEDKTYNGYLIKTLKHGKYMDGTKTITKELLVSARKLEEAKNSIIAYAEMGRHNL